MKGKEGRNVTFNLEICGVVTAYQFSRTSGSNPRSRAKLSKKNLRLLAFAQTTAASKVRKIR